MALSVPSDIQLKLAVAWAKDKQYLCIQSPNAPGGIFAVPSSSKPVAMPVLPLAP